MKASVRRLTGLLPAPLWVLLLVLSLTVVATATVRELVKQQQLARFDREITAYQRELRQRFQGYAGVLVAVRASWEAVAAPPTSTDRVQPALSSQQFGRLVLGLNLAARYPGLSSLGYAPLITASGRGVYARQLPLVAGDPDAELHPSSQLALSAPITYLFPAAANSGLLGFDMYTDRVRRAAIDQSVGSGAVTATGQIELLNLPLSEADRNGLILYLPLRSQGRVTGLLYAPLRLSAVLPTPMADSVQNRLSMKIWVDGQDLGPPPTGTPQRSENDLNKAFGGFQQTETLVLAGQTWTLAFSAPSGFGRDAAANVPWLVLLVGTLVALLAAAATQAQVGARVRAERVSHSLSLSQSRLERSRAEFEAVFRAMQDTAVFTDLSGRVLFANDALQGSFGLNPFELRGAPLADLHADTKLLSRLDALPGPHLVTTQFRRKDRLARNSGSGPTQNDQAQARTEAQSRTQLFYGEMQRSRVVGESGEILGHLEIIRDVSERLEADRALRAGERRYQGVLEGMPQIVFLTDATGQVSYLNRRWWEYVGGSERPERAPSVAVSADTGSAATANADVSKADTVAASPQTAPDSAQSVAFQPDWTGQMLKAVHPDDRTEFQRRWQESLLSERELELEHRLRSETGQYRTFVTRVRPVFVRGKVQEWVGSSTDIDDQIYAEAHSRLLADVGQALNDRTHGGASAHGTNPHGTGDAADHERRGPESQNGGSDTGLGSAEDLWQTDTGLRAALSLMTARFADSAVFWPGPDIQGAELASSDRFGADGTDGEGAQPFSEFDWPAPLIAGRARRIGMRELGEIERLNETVTELMYRHEPAVFHGGRLHDLGLSSAVLYPLSQDDLPLGVLGLGFRQPLQDRDLELARELAQRLNTALDNRNLLLRLQLARESLQELNGTLEQRVAERTLQLSEANSELEAFSYSVSHDLRTPLRHILGFADLLKRETELNSQPRPEQPGAEQLGTAPPGTGPKAVRYLNIIVDSASRMSRLIDDLLEFSRTSRAELRRSTVDLAQLVQEGRQGLAPDQGERRVEWNIGPLPVVIGDPGLLRQVIDNLLSNALKYTRTREQAVIEIRSQHHDREVWLSIRDNGVGFDPEYVGKLFGVFQRLHRNEEFEGTGIGLANVRRIVARHGGRVWAESGQDSQPGATFWVALPLEPLSLQKADKRAKKVGDLQVQSRPNPAGASASGKQPEVQP
ncbi:ATP-binding protein [Deinococcus sp. UYEF24]